MEAYTPFMDYDADNQCIIVIDDGIPSFQSYMITNNEGCWRKQQKEKKNKWREDQKEKELQYNNNDDNIKQLKLEKPNNGNINQHNNQYYNNYGLNGYGVTMTPHQHPQTPSPVSPQSPPTPTMQYNIYNQYQYQHQYQQQNQMKQVKYKPCTDLFEINKKYKGLIFKNKSRSSSADCIKRTVKQNGVNYEAYGIEIIGSESYEWNFILTERSSMIFGLIDATKTEQNLLYILNTDDQRMKNKLFKNGQQPDDIIIKIMYNVPNKCMIVENVDTSGNSYDDSMDKGQRYIFAQNIDTNLKYRLCVLLDKPGEVTIIHDI